MIILIGQENCNQCILSKNLLASRELEYSYRDLSSLSEIEQKDLLELAKKEGIISLPLILDEGKMITFDALIEKIKTLR